MPQNCPLPWGVPDPTQYTSDSQTTRWPAKIFGRTYFIFTILVFSTATHSRSVGYLSLVCILASPFCVKLHCIYINRGISRLLFNVHKRWFRWLFKKVSEVAPQTSLYIAFGPLSEMLGNHQAYSTRSRAKPHPNRHLEQFSRFSRAHRHGNVTAAGWQVTLCDPMWHVSSRSGVATLRTAIHLLLTYLYEPQVLEFKVA